MKKVLLSTTALVFMAGVASADITMSGSATIKSSNFGTGSTAGDNDQSISAETDVTITLSGGNDAISYSASLELDEDGGLSDGPLNVSMGGLSLTYDDGALGMVDTDGDGEDDAYGDYTIGYAMGGLSVSYTGDNESDDNILSIGYAADGMSVTITDTTETAGTGDNGTNTAKDETKIAVSYAMGAITVGYTMAGDEGANMGDDYDISLGYTAGALSASFASNEENRTRLVAEYDLGGATAFFSSQQGGAAGTDLQALGINFAF